jgi:hypothetical protein
VFATLKLRDGVDRISETSAVQYLTALEKMESVDTLVADVGEARWIVDTLQNMLDRGVASQDIHTRAEILTRAINERLMSTYPMLSSLRAPLTQESSIWEELQAAGYTGGPILEPLHPQQLPQRDDEQLLPDVHQPTEEQRDEHPPKTDDDEMADTAGRLLERVADNTSAKFQNSQFLSLMRKLRDREVKVEGDKMVDVSAAQSPFPNPQQADRLPAEHRQQHSGASSAIPGIDPTILDHADTDFALPVFSDEGHDEYASSHAQVPQSSSRRVGKEQQTDEVTDQYRHYNVHATYHK